MFVITWSTQHNDILATKPECLQALMSSGAIFCWDGLECNLFNSNMLFLELHINIIKPMIKLKHKEGFAQLICNLD